MAKYRCEACGYVYDPEKNNGTDLEDQPDSWICPCCGAGKDQFI